MARVKSWKKRGRAFLQPPASECMAGVSWRVAYVAPKLIPAAERKYYEDDERTDERHAKARMSACILINEEGKEHYVSRKGDLRAIQNMRRELNKFEELCEKALQDVEEANAES